MKNLLNHATHEIRNLRRENELLRAQVRVINIFDRAMGGASPMGMASPDVLWELGRKIAEIEEGEKPLVYDSRDQQVKVQPVAPYPQEDREPPHSKLKTEDDSRG